MYICPVCGKEFDNEDALVRHYTKCWREKNPMHKSKPAPRSADINARKVNNDVMNFFSSFG